MVLANVMCNENDDNNNNDKHIIAVASASNGSEPIIFTSSKINTEIVKTADADDAANPPRFWSHTTLKSILDRNPDTVELVDQIAVLGSEMIPDDHPDILAIKLPHHQTRGAMRSYNALKIATINRLVAEKKKAQDAALATQEAAATAQLVPSEAIDTPKDTLPVLPDVPEPESTTKKRRGRKPTTKTTTTTTTTEPLVSDLDAKHELATEQAFVAAAAKHSVVHATFASHTTDEKKHNDASFARVAHKVNTIKATVAAAADPEDFDEIIDEDEFLNQMAKNNSVNHHHNNHHHHHQHHSTTKPIIGVAGAVTSGSASCCKRPGFGSYEQFVDLLATLNVVFIFGFIVGGVIYLTCSMCCSIRMHFNRNATTSIALSNMEANNTCTLGRSNNNRIVDLKMNVLNGKPGKQYEPLF